MKWLVLIHVLSAIIGIGPTYVLPIILRKKQSVLELNYSLKIGSFLELFPKTLGLLAVLSGLALFFTGDYGRFTQIWLMGSLILYIIVQIIVIGFSVPTVKKLKGWAADPANHQLQTLPSPQAQLLNKSLNLTYLACILGVILFVFMIIKPA